MASEIFDLPIRKNDIFQPDFSNAYFKLNYLCFSNSTALLADLFIFEFFFEFWPYETYLFIRNQNPLQYAVGQRQVMSNPYI